MASPFTWDAYGMRRFSTDENGFCETCGNVGVEYAFCIDCETDLCKNCYDWHDRFKATRKHRVEVIQKGRYVHCRHHTGKYLNLFCFNHLEPICGIGQKESHIVCKVKLLDSLEYINKSEAQLMINQTRQIRTDILKATEHKVNDVAAQKDYTLKLDSEYWHNIYLKIKQCRQKRKKGVYEAFDKEVKRTHDAANKALELLNKLEKSIEEKHTNIPGHRRVLSLDEIADEIAEVKLTVRQVHEPVKVFNRPDYLTSFEKYVSDVNCQNTESVDDKKCVDISSLSDSVDLETDSGNFDSYDDSFSQSVDNSIASEEHGYALVQMEGTASIYVTKDVQHTTARPTDPLYIKTEEDSDDCCITGMSVFSDGNLLLADCYNKRIKLFSVCGDHISSIETPSEPFDVTITRKGDAAVSMWMNQKEIVLIDVKQNTLSVKCNIKLRNRIYGIVAIEDDFVISCDDKIPSVRRVNRSGETKWELSFSSEGRKVFKAPGYLVTKMINHDQYILVSDNEMHCINMIEAKTGRLLKVLPQSKTGPQGLTKDNFEFIYVGYRHNVGIRVWASDMTEHKTILSSGESKRPQAIAFNPFTEELLVSSWRSNVVERFKIFHT